MKIQRKYLIWQTPPALTEEQIKIRAYEIWKRRGRLGTDEENWCIAIAELRTEQSYYWKLRGFLLLPFLPLVEVLRFLWLLLPRFFRHSMRLALIAETPSAALEVVKVAISAFGVLATIFAGVGLYLTYQNTQGQLESAKQERQLNSQRLVTDRFAKAVEQLGNQDVNVRLGGIYSLESIAEGNSEYYWTVQEILSAFIREKSPLRDCLKSSVKRCPLLQTDVQSALTVIGRRDGQKHRPYRDLNLSQTNLSGAKLNGIGIFDSITRTLKRSNADLSNVNFNGSILRESNFNHATLRDANFINADLRDANFINADLISANFSGADLRGARFNEGRIIVNNKLEDVVRKVMRESRPYTYQMIEIVGINRTDLSNANFEGADLRNAFLAGINLSNANFRGANLSGIFFNHCSLEGANLEGANLRGAEFSSLDQIRSAGNWQKAHYDPFLRKRLGLPAEKL